MTKVVITAAGKGTRLLPFTKEMPKEMMPIFSNAWTNKKVIVPLLQYVYEQLYSMNFRDYCFIVGREKRSIEDHFTPHEMYLRNLSGDYKKIISKFYQKLEKSHLVWINQHILTLKYTIGVRVSKRIEEEGLDVYEHGESAFN